MRLYIILYLLSYVNSLTTFGKIDYQDVSTDDLEEHWFEQYLDHFDVLENRTFKMRYFEINDFYRHGGPLLLEIGGEEGIDSSNMRYNPNYKLAQQLHGKIVLLEHRYYGKSDPFDIYNTTDNYDYLSVEQALEDIAYFIETYKNMTPGMNNSKVAVFGCSYAGSLATWMRSKFPHLVDAAWASSAPLKMTLDFYQYYEVAGELYSNVSSECIAIIRQGYREAKDLLSTPKGTKIVKELFDGWACGNVTEMNSTDILATIRLVLSNQYTEPGYGKESCKFLQSKNESTSCFEQLAELVLRNADDVCYEDDPDDEIAWTYQTCSQLGFSFTLNSHNQPFKDSVPVIDIDVAYCAETFGEEFNLEQLKRGIARMNRVYGSTKLQVSKVVTIQGTHDPWNKVGLQHQLNKDAPVFMVPGSSHCADVSKQDYVLPELVEAKSSASNLMLQWLK